MGGTENDKGKETKWWKVILDIFIPFAIHRYLSDVLYDADYTGICHFIYEVGRIQFAGI